MADETDVEPDGIDRAEAYLNYAHEYLLSSIIAGTADPAVLIQLANAQMALHRAKRNRDYQRKIEYWYPTHPLAGPRKEGC